MSTEFSKLDKDVKRRIIQAANTIRKKYLALKLERGEEDEALNKFLSPITNPLNKMIENSAKQGAKKHKIKTEAPQSAPGTSRVKYRAPSPVAAAAAAAREEQYGDISDGEDEVFEPSVPNLKDDLESTLRNNPIVYQEFINQYPAIAREYLIKYWIRSSDSDDGNGLEYDHDTGSWKMGDLPTRFLDNGDIQVGDVRYPGTPGLYDLIFLKDPIIYTKSDQEQFADIVKRTNIYQKGDKSPKYTKIVKPLTTAPVRSMSSASVEAARLKNQRKSSGKTTPSGVVPPRKSSRLASAGTSKSVGKALVEYNEKPAQFVYYDDVNELVERLKKLEASKHVGNNNNIDEIMSILRELERLGVIEFYK